MVESYKLTNTLPLSALTLENLEESFYREGFAKFSASDFTALGLSDEQIKDLQGIGFTESEHVIILQSSLAQNGIQPVQRCTYNFGFTSAAAMVQTAAILENVGISAYLGAAPLLASSMLLSVPVPSSPSLLSSSPLAPRAPTSSLPPSLLSSWPTPATRLLSTLS